MQNHFAKKASSSMKINDLPEVYKIVTVFNAQELTLHKQLFSP